MSFINYEVRYAKTYGETDGVIHRLVMLHRPVIGSSDQVICVECGKNWPCTTYVFIEETVV